MIDYNFVKNNIQEYSTALFINSTAIIENYNIIKSQLDKNTMIAPVLKNNAYGMGTENIHDLLKKYSNDYFVFNIKEGLELRKVNKSCNIYVLLGCREYQEDVFHGNNLTPVLNTKKQIMLWNNYGKSLKQALPCVIQIETGLNRFGIQRDIAEEIHQHPRLVSYLDIKYIMSHFACSDMENHFSIEEQYNQFKEIITILPPSKYSLSASYAIFNDKKYHFDMVRPGISLYGGNPNPWTTNPMNPVIYLYSTIMQIKTIKTGDYVGYGYTWQAKRPTIVATVPVGYADGILRSFSNSGFVMIEGKKAPIIGRISMDSITLDVTDIPQKLRHEGQIVEIIGDNISLDEFSIFGDTNPCEAIGALTYRYPRFYINQ